MRKALLLLVALVAFATGMYAQNQVLRVRNGRIDGRLNIGAGTPTHQPVILFGYTGDQPCGVNMIRAILNVEQGEIAQFNVKETFTAETERTSSSFETSVRNVWGRGVATILARPLGCNQPRGRYDYEVAPLSATGQLVKNQYGQSQRPTRFSVWVGNTRADFVQPNLNLRLSKVSVENGWLDLVGLMEPGVTMNLYFGSSVIDGWVVNTRSYHWRELHIPLSLYGAESASPRMVVLATEDGSASATYFLPQ